MTQIKARYARPAFVTRRFSPTVPPVTARSEDYLGIKGMMDAEAPARLMREAPTVTSVHLSLDENRLEGKKGASVV